MSEESRLFDELREEQAEHTKAVARAELAERERDLAVVARNAAMARNSAYRAALEKAWRAMVDGDLAPSDTGVRDALDAPDDAGTKWLAEHDEMVGDEAASQATAVALEVIEGKSKYEPMALALKQHDEVLTAPLRARIARLTEAVDGLISSGCPIHGLKFDVSCGEEDFNCAGCAWLRVKLGVARNEATGVVLRALDVPEREAKIRDETVDMLIRHLRGESVVLAPALGEELAKVRDEAVSRRDDEWVDACSVGKLNELDQPRDLIAAVRDEARRAAPEEVRQCPSCGEKSGCDCAENRGEGTLDMGKP